MHTYPSRKEKKSGKRELVTVRMRKQTDKQGVDGVVESESTWFCDTHTQDIFDMTSVFISYNRRDQVRPDLVWYNWGIKKERQEKEEDENRELEMGRKWRWLEKMKHEKKFGRKSHKMPEIV